MISPKRRLLARRLSYKETLAIWLIGIALSLGIGLLGAASSAPTVRLDNLLLDSLLRATASGAPAKRTVVIDIDDVSLAAVGQWPWPRYRIAALIERIAAAQPVAIALDILLPETDRSSLLSIQKTFKRDFGLDIFFSGAPAGLLDNDGYLADEIARGEVIASNYFYFDHVTPDAQATPPSLSFDGRTDLLRPIVATGTLVNTPAIASRTRHTGFVNNRLDDDGVLRRLPLLIEHAGALYPSLPLAAVMRASGVTHGTIVDADHVLALRIGERRVPIDAHAEAMLRFNGRPALYPSLPAVDVLNGAYRASELKGKIVFVGTSAVGLNDYHNTAVDARFPGLKIQAAMAENMLSSDVVAVPAWAGLAGFVACLAIGALMSTLFVVASGLYPMIAGCLLTWATTLTVCATVFLNSGRFIPVAAQLLLVAALFVTFVAIRFVIERRRTWRGQKLLENARQVTIEAMASVAETRDPETGAHIKRTQHYVRAVAEELRRNGDCVDTLTPDYIELLFLSAPLHDIGKVGVPDHILLKPGRLTPAEMEQMKRHAEFGRKIIHSTAESIDGDNFLSIAGEIAGSHHEKWDGSGYPLGLAGAAIPLPGRIMAIADIYDALISRRCYKAPFPHAQAMAMIREGRGTTFDPVVLDAFLCIEPTIQDIAHRYQDEPVDEGPAELTVRIVDSVRAGAASKVLSEVER